MIPLAEAQAEVIAACRPGRPRTIPVADALGLVLAERVVAADPVPPFRNSAMDGYAVRAADTAGAGVEHPARLKGDRHLGRRDGSNQPRRTWGGPEDHDGRSFSRRR